MNNLGPSVGVLTGNGMRRFYQHLGRKRVPREFRFCEILYAHPDNRSTTTSELAIIKAYAIRRANTAFVAQGIKDSMSGSKGRAKRKSLKRAALILGAKI